jgi:hypothetical protein
LVKADKTPNAYPSGGVIAPTVCLIFKAVFCNKRALKYSNCIDDTLSVIYSITQKNTKLKQKHESIKKYHGKDDRGM